MNKEDLINSDIPEKELDAADILKPNNLDSNTDLDIGEKGMIFESSGSSGKPKKIPFTAKEIVGQREHEAEVYRFGGLEKSDYLFNLGAPIPSISAWAGRSAAFEIGAAVLNRSFSDYEEVLEWKFNEKATVLLATPLVAYSIGEEIEENYGKPRDHFPEMRLGIFFGDHLPENIKEELRQMWGFEKLLSLYGSVETGAIAIEDKESGNLIPKVDRLILEIIPEDSETPVNIMDLEEEKTGTLLLTDPERDKIDLTRYEIGDAIRVIPGNIPEIQVLGREDNCINLGGAPLYENQIHKSITDIYGSNFKDWKLIVSESGIKPSLEIIIAAEDVEKRERAVLNRLFDRAPPLKEAVEDVGRDGIIENIEMRVVQKFEELDWNLKEKDFERDLKSKRIIFE